jgi:hypothetical protein
MTLTIEAVPKAIDAPINADFKVEKAVLMPLLQINLANYIACGDAARKTARL